MIRLTTRCICVYLICVRLVHCEDIIIDGLRERLSFVSKLRRDLQSLEPVGNEIVSNTNVNYTSYSPVDATVTQSSVYTTDAQQFNVTYARIDQVWTGQCAALL
jgi:hypothetical protein